MAINCLWNSNHLGCSRTKLRACPYHCDCDAIACSDYIYDDHTKTSALDKLAAWADVSEKAHAIVETGGVEIIEETPQEVRAYVMSGQVSDRFPVSDGGPYEVILSKKSWGNKGNVGGWVQGYLCNCFIPGTLVTMADGSMKKIEDIQTGDMVLAGDGKAHKVNHTMSRDVDEEITKIKIWGMGETISCTNEHPFWAIEKIRCNRCESHDIHPLKCGDTHGGKTPPRWMNADELNRGMYLQLPKPAFNQKDILFDLADYCDEYKECEDGKEQTAKRIMAGDGQWVRIENVSHEHYRGKVYNLEVDEDNTYLVNGIKVHNCEWGYYNSGEPGARYRGRFCSHAMAALLVSNMRARKDFMNDRKVAFVPYKDWGWTDYPGEGWKFHGYMNDSFAVIYLPHSNTNPSDRYLLRFQEYDRGPSKEYYGDSLEELMSLADNMAEELGCLSSVANRRDITAANLPALSDFESSINMLDEECYLWEGPQFGVYFIHINNEWWTWQVQGNSMEIISQMHLYPAPTTLEEAYDDFVLNAKEDNLGVSFDDMSYFSKLERVSGMKFAAVSLEWNEEYDGAQYGKYLLPGGGGYVQYNVTPSKSYSAGTWYVYAEDIDKEIDGGFCETIDEGKRYVEGVIDALVDEWNYMGNRKKQSALPGWSKTEPYPGAPDSYELWFNEEVYAVVENHETLGWGYYIYGPTIGEHQKYGFSSDDVAMENAEKLIRSKMASSANCLIEFCEFTENNVVDSKIVSYGSEMSSPKYWVNHWPGVDIDFIVGRNHSTLDEQWILAIGDDDNVLLLREDWAGGDYNFGPAKFASVRSASLQWIDYGENALAHTAKKAALEVYRDTYEVFEVGDQFYYDLSGDPNKYWEIIEIDYDNDELLMESYNGEQQWFTADYIADDLASEDFFRLAKKAALEDEPDEVKQAFDDLIQMLQSSSYEGLSQNLDAICNDPKTLELLRMGFGSGEFADLEMDSSLSYVPVSQLNPMQNEIGLPNSLAWPLSGKANPDMYFQSNVTIGGPIVTLNGSYIIDGHHRWSQLYMMNPDASIEAVNFICSNSNPEDALRVFQAAIAATHGSVPHSDGGVANVYAMSENEIYSWIDGEMIDSAEVAIADFIGAEDRDGVISYLVDNALSLPKPSPGAPDRKYMPQTDSMALDTVEDGYTEV